VIDTDPGIDDAIALFVALASPELDIVGVTAVAGNVGLDHTSRNALRLVHLAGRSDIPVAAGADRPLVHLARRASLVHGDDGVGGVELPEPEARLDGRHAIELIADAADAAPLTIVAIGPLTNLALLLARYPGITARIERVVIMGGSTGAGNVTEAAEFNIWVDPEAAVRVFTSGIPIVLEPLDVTQQAFLEPGEVDQLRERGTRCAAAAASMLDAYRDLRPGRRLIMHDAVAIAELLAPGLIRHRPRHIAVDDGHGDTRGRTVAGSGAENAEVADAVDRDAFAGLLLERIGRLP
jgi:pyrimidine-specific ribonucleoside hydrolase